MKNIIGSLAVYALVAAAIAVPFILMGMFLIVGFVDDANYVQTSHEYFQQGGTICVE